MCFSLVFDFSKNIEGHFGMTLNSLSKGHRNSNVEKHLSKGRRNNNVEKEYLTKSKMESLVHSAP